MYAINVDDIANRFISFIILNRYVFDKKSNELNYGLYEKQSFDSLIAKVKNVKEIPSAEYIAKNLGFKYQSKSGKSFYDVNHEVNIYDKEGNLHKGIIRISNHNIYINKWVENSQYDWGISVVICEKPLFINSNDEVEETLNNRLITIYEYCINAKRQCINKLDAIVSDIIENKKNGFYIDSMIRGYLPKIKTNQQLTEKILYTINETLKKILKQI